MINEAVLRESLIGLIEHCKEQAGISIKLLNEVTVLREALRSLNPPLDTALAKKRGEHSTEQLQKITIELFDGIARKIDADLTPN
jgi:hypothetical protein